MELHFCSQCGISIPLAEVEAGTAAGGEGRLLCAEHRSGSSRGATATAVSADPAGGAKESFELLFCANCQVSVPIGDVESGRARREFGSLLCAPCSAADHVERDRRRKAVAEEMADDAPVTPRRCGTCSATVSPAELASGRAVTVGDRITCARCREPAAAPAPALHSGRAASIAAQPAPSATSWILVLLLIVACAAAGFFGVEYVRAQKAPGTSAAPPATVAGSAQLEQLRSDMDRRVASEAASLAREFEASLAAQKQAIERLDARLTESLGVLRQDVAEMRTAFGDSDKALSERLARLEGQVASLQEMTRGLAARPAAEAPRTPPTETVKGPENPGPPAPPMPGKQVDPQVVTLLKVLRESKEVGDRFNAAQELTKLKAREAIPTFAELAITDPNMLVRRSCAKGLGELKAWHGMPVLIQVLEDAEAYVAQQANFAIQSITAQDFGVTVEHSIRDRKTRANTARKWWDKNKDTPPDGVCLDPIEQPKQ